MLEEDLESERVSDNIFGQGKTTWVDSACADYPGFLVPRAAGTRLPASSKSLRLCPRASICCRAPWTFAWICCSQLPHHPCKAEHTHHKFLQRKGAYTDFRDNGKRGVSRLPITWTFKTARPQTLLLHLTTSQDRANSCKETVMLQRCNRVFCHVEA